LQVDTKKIYKFAVTSNLVILLSEGLFSSCKLSHYCNWCIISNSKNLM